MSTHRYIIVYITNIVGQIVNIMTKEAFLKLNHFERKIQYDADNC